MRIALLLGVWVMLGLGGVALAKDIEVGHKETRITGVGSLDFGTSAEDLPDRGYSKDPPIEGMPDSWSGMKDYLPVGDDLLEGDSSATVLDGKVESICLSFRTGDPDLARELFEAIEKELLRTYDVKVTRLKDRGNVFMVVLNDAHGNQLTLDCFRWGCGLCADSRTMFKWREKQPAGG